MKAIPGTKDWTKEDLRLYGLENKGFVAKIRTSKLTRIIAKFLGLKDKGLEIRFEFPRGFIKYMKRSKINEPLIGVEIGVLEGKHSESILKELRIKKLFLIDVYADYDEKEKFNISYDDSYERAKKRLEKFAGKIQFIKKLSSQAVKDVPNNLDFVYIDGNHTYKYVKEDIKNYYPKLKKSGILAGHDFDYLSPGVIKAVIEFVYKNKLELQTDPFQSDWWIVKK